MGGHKNERGALQLGDAAIGFHNEGVNVLQLLVDAVEVLVAAVGE